jgi:hypothetical protein
MCFTLIDKLGVLLCLPFKLKYSSFLIENKHHEKEIEELTQELEGPPQVLRSYLDKKGKSGTPIDPNLCLDLNMKNSDDTCLISSISHRLPPLKQIKLKCIPPSGDPSLTNFLSVAVPRTLQSLQFNNYQNGLVDCGKYIETIEKALAKASREVCMYYFDLKKEHLQTVVEQAHQVETLIVEECKVEVIELSHYECLY